MNERTLNVELRNDFGKNACNRLRKSGFIPAVLYSHGTTEPLKIDAKTFSSIFKGHISESVLIDLNITDKSDDPNHQAFVKDYQLDPVTNEIIHIDFFKITAGEKIRTLVSLEVVGTPKGVKTGGILEIIERELEIECLPKDLPEHIVINVDHLDIGESLHIGDINIGESIKFMETADRVILSVVVPHAKEAEAEVEEAEAEEGIAEKAEVGSEEPKEESND